MAPAQPRPEGEAVSALRIVLPVPPNRGNDRSHWRKVAREKAAYYAAARVRILQQTTVAQRAAGPDDHFVVSAALFVWNRFDDDGAVALLKWPIDALGYARVLYQDKRPWCALAGIPNQHIDRKSPHIVLLIEPLSPETT